MGTMTVSYAPWSFGAFWGEFGVLNPEGGNGPVAPGGILNTGDGFHSQYLAATGGFMLGGVGREPVYLRLGLGAYRYDSDAYPKRWLVAANLGFGALIGPPAWHARPVLEARVHFPSETRPYSDDALANVMLSLSGGVWFR